MKKNIKKLICIMVMATMILGSTLTAHAESKMPSLTLEANEYNSNGERHIKVSWEGTSGTYQIQLDDSADFESPIGKKRTSKQGRYYNFVLNENVDATYYIRVRLANGEWSNVVVADMGEPIETESTSYFNFPKFPVIPDISGSIKAPEIVFDKNMFAKILEGWSR